MTDILLSLASDRDHRVAALDHQVVDSDPVHRADHEARTEEEVWADYEARVQTGEITSDEAYASFCKWRYLRLGQPAVATEAHRPLPGSEHAIARIEVTQYYASF